MKKLNKNPQLDISVVIPLFNEEESLPELYSWIERVMEEHGFSFASDSAMFYKGIIDIVLSY